MTPRRVEITLSEELWGRLELARLREPRASFVRRALESALGSGSGRVEESASDGRELRDLRSASSRASGKKPSVADTWRR